MSSLNDELMKQRFEEMYDDKMVYCRDCKYWNFMTDHKCTRSFYGFPRGNTMSGGHGCMFGDKDVY